MANTLDLTDETPDTTTSDVHVTKRLSWPMVAIPGVLVLIYGMLSFISLGDQSFFYESMEIPTPEHEFLLWSWGGKNTAMLAVIAAGFLSRLRLVVGLSLGMLLVGQLGDINAGAQSGTNVFITWIAFGLVVAQIALMELDRRRNG